MPHMICQYESSFAALNETYIIYDIWHFETVTERNFRSEIQSKETNTNDVWCALDFLRKTRPVTVPRFGLFQDSPISVYI